MYDGVLADAVASEHGEWELCLWFHLGIVSVKGILYSETIYMVMAGDFWRGFPGEPQRGAADRSRGGDVAEDCRGERSRDRAGRARLPLLHHRVWQL